MKKSDFNKKIRDDINAQLEKHEALLAITILDMVSTGEVVSSEIKKVASQIFIERSNNNEVSES